MKIRVSLISESAAAPKTLDVNTLKGLSAFFESIGMTKGKTPTGGGRPLVGTILYETKGSILRKCAPLRSSWEFKPTSSLKGESNFSVVNKADPAKKFTIQSNTAGSKVYLYKKFFTDASTPVDIYNVTKHHPAWMYVANSLDQRGNPKGKKRVEAVKEIIDDYLVAFQETPESLANKIRIRTKNGTVHGMYEGI